MGAATALATARRGNGSPSAAARPLWVPALVLLAYLPDLPGALLPGAMFGEARALGHSVLFAAVLTAPLGYALARWARVGVGVGMAIVATSVLIHDVLDVLQSTDRTPLWPFSREPWRLSTPVLPRGTTAEATLFAMAFVAFLLLYAARDGSAAYSSLWPSASRARWASALGTGLVMLAAVGVHVARGVREREYRDAEAVLRDGRYSEALALLDRADSWPSVTAPGRIDYLRGESYRGLGEAALAEVYYLKSFHANPRYFWLLADLAAFYAGSDRPLADRRRLVEPLVARLREDFAHEADLPRLLSRIEHRLTAGPSEERRAEEGRP